MIEQRTTRVAVGSAARGAAEILTLLVVAVLTSLVVFTPMPERTSQDLREKDGGEYSTRGLGDYRCSDLKLVYHGRPPLMFRPCVVSADAVYAHIPEYQEIRARGLSSSKPRYHFLMRKASERFVRALKAMAREHGHDVVVEAGGITTVDPGAPEPPDRTDETIQALSR